MVSLRGALPRRNVNKTSLKKRYMLMTSLAVIVTSGINVNVIKGSKEYGKLAPWRRDRRHVPVSYR